jgi:ribosomal protein S18 acetylase RimI-like enzyme
VIRPVQTTELAALADVAARTYADSFGDTYTPQDLARELAQNRSEAYFRSALEKGDIILVVAEDGQLRGFTQIKAVDLPELDPQPGDQLLDKVYVDPEWQGQGIGRRLLEATLAHPRLSAAKRVFLQVRSNNHRALSLYRSLGFEVVGSTRLGVGDRQREDDYIMMRPAKVTAKR